jgi:hypothetical protein
MRRASEENVKETMHIQTFASGEGTILRAKEQAGRGLQEQVHWRKRGEVEDCFREWERGDVGEVLDWDYDAAAAAAAAAAALTAVPSASHSLRACKKVRKQMEAVTQKHNNNRKVSVAEAAVPCKALFQASHSIVLPICIYARAMGSKN